MSNHSEQLERTNENVQNNAERKLLRRTRGYDPRPKARIKPVPPEFLESSPQKKKPLKPAPKKALLKPEKPQTPQKRTKKLTVLIDTELLTKFKIQALTDETTLSALATKAFEDYLDQTEAEEQAPCSRKLPGRTPHDQVAGIAEKE